MVWLVRDPIGLPETLTRQPSCLLHGLLQLVGLLVRTSKRSNIGLDIGQQRIKLPFPLIVEYINVHGGSLLLLYLPC